MLRHNVGGYPSTYLEIGEVNRLYVLNDHAKTLLGIGLEFWEPIKNDIPTKEENLRSGSNLDSDFEEERDPAQLGDEVDVGDAMGD